MPSNPTPPASPSPPPSSPGPANTALTPTTPTRTCSSPPLTKPARSPAKSPGRGTPCPVTPWPTCAPSSPGSDPATARPGTQTSRFTQSKPPDSPASTGGGRSARLGVAVGGRRRRATAERLGREENAELAMERDSPQALSGPVGQGGDEVSVAAFISSPEDRPRRTPRVDLSGAGAVRVVVLQVARPAADRPRAATGRTRRADPDLSSTPRAALGSP